METFIERLKALKAKVPQEGIILTESQLAAPEKAKELREANGDIDWEHPGCLGAQDIYDAGSIKGAGRIYRQTFTDTYSRVATAKLYTEKTPTTAADLFNDRVLACYECSQVVAQSTAAGLGTMPISSTWP